MNNKKIYSFSMYENEVDYLDEIVAKQLKAGFKISRSQALQLVINTYKAWENESRDLD